MQIKLFHKLFLAMVITSFATLLLFAAATHWTMQRSFTRYLNDVRAERLEELAAAFAGYYRDTGDWSGLKVSPRAWRRELSIHFNGLHRPPAPGNGFSPVIARHGRPRFFVYDAERRPVIGHRPFSNRLHTLAIEVDDRTVGWIAMPPLRRAAAPPDRRFEKRQMQVMLNGALIAGLLSVVVAWFTARRLARPIRRIGDAARALAGGDFETRLASGGQDEIGKLAEDFNVLARTLHENDAARRRWIADISHELRTPLAIMHGELEAVRDGVRNNDERLVDSLRLETERMNRLIEDLYQLSRADIGAMDYRFEPTSLSALTTQAVSRFANRFEEAGLAYTYEIDPGVNLSADGARLTQMIENLLENCCRYVDRPGQVRVTLTRADDRALLHVEDSGPGVPESAREKIFDPLHRLEHSRNRRYGGAGLGLALCARIVDAHGGRIRARSSELGGLGIEVDLPCEGRR